MILGLVLTIRPVVPDGNAIIFNFSVLSITILFPRVAVANYCQFSSTDQNVDVAFTVTPNSDRVGIYGFTIQDCMVRILIEFLKNLNNFEFCRFWFKVDIILSFEFFFYVN